MSLGHCDNHLPLSNVIAARSSWLKNMIAHNTLPNHFDEYLIVLANFEAKLTKLFY